MTDSTPISAVISDFAAAEGPGKRRLFLADYEPSELAAWFANRPAPHNQAFRAKQVLTHFFHRLAGSYAEMTDLPADLRPALETDLPLDPLEIVGSTDDGFGSTKLAIRPIADVPKLGGSGIVECMVMRDESRDARTICVSTQVGCAMGCQFCASGLDGLVRNLTTSEILGQLWHAARMLSAEGFSSAPSDGRRGRRQRQRHASPDAPSASATESRPTITNVVFMGVGEPLANTAHLFPTLRALTEPWGFGLSARRITISTVGILPGIYKLADSGIGANLAISLHAADDETRQRIIRTRPGKAPENALDTIAAAARTEVDQLLAAGDYYFEKTGREVTIEFILLPQINGHQAPILADLLRRHRRGKYNVNVIPYNKVAEFPWAEPTPEQVRDFLDQLRERGVNAHARKKMGYGINGACGQLRLTRPTPQADPSA